MDSPKENNKIHFSISTFKKTKALSSVIEIEDSEKKVLASKMKRSSSYVIPKRFVPKIKPKKTTKNPSYFILNEKNNKKEENSEIKSVKEILSNEDNMSYSSLSESFSDIENENNSNKFNYFKEEEINNIKIQLNFQKKNEIQKKNDNNSLSSLSNIRKKMQQIKNNSCLIRIKECIDLNLLNLKKKFSFNDIYFNKDIHLKNENNNYIKFKSSFLLCENENKKRNKPFLIFDVLTQSSQKNNL